MAAWDTAGNNIGSNAFLGSTSAEPLRIRTNNVEKMIITTDGNVGIGTPTPFTPTPGARLTVAGGDITWGNNSRLGRDQGGSIELGGDSNIAGTGTPYIDFHFQGLAQDFNTRIINDASGQLTISAGTLRALGNVLLPNAIAGTDGNLYFGGRTDTGQLGMRLFGGRVNPGPGEIHAGFIDVRTDTNTDGLRIRVDTATGGTERMRVTADGNVGIGTGTTPPGARLTVAGGDITWGNNSRLQTDQGGSIELGSDRNTAGAGTPYIDFHFRGITQDFNTRIINDGDRLLSIRADGGQAVTLRVEGAALKPGGGPWGSTSDVRLKKNVNPLKGALGKLLRLRGMRFEWKEPEKHGNLVGPQLGLVAQDVEEVFPEWVDRDPSGYKILTVRGFEALAIEAFRELKAENETLKPKNEELEDRIKILESTIVERQPSGNLNGAVR